MQVEKRKRPKRLRTTAPTYFKGLGGQHEPKNGQLEPKRAPIFGPKKARF